MIVIDATDTILGRLCTYAAKRALLGETVHIINAEKAVITGQRASIFKKYENTRSRGAPLVGPYFPRVPERIVKRTVRGMLPHKKARGSDAYDRVKCHVGTPEDLKGQKHEKLENAHISRTYATYITVRELSEHLGAKAQ